MPLFGRRRRPGLAALPFPPLPPAPTTVIGGAVIAAEAPKALGVFATLWSLLAIGRTLWPLMRQVAAHEVAFRHLRAAVDFLAAGNTRAALSEALAMLAAFGFDLRPILSEALEHHQHLQVQDPRR